MPQKLIIAYRTRPAEVEVPMPTFKAPSQYKAQDKIDAYIADKEAAFLASLKDKPYTGTFDEVKIFDTGHEEMVTYKYRAPDSDKPPVCLAIRDWLLKRYPKAWPNSTNFKGLPEAVFIGFNPRLFVKMLGIECSLPENQPMKEGERDPSKTNALPLSMWYGQSDYRDIEEAAKPKEFDLSWEIVLGARGLSFPGWAGPGTDPETDLKIAIELASQLGMLTEA